jgi:hypothetical protein
MAVPIFESPAGPTSRNGAENGATGATADEVRSAHVPSPSVHVLAGSEEVAAAYRRVREFEYRVAEQAEARAVRHHAALAKAERADKARPRLP